MDVLSQYGVRHVFGLPGGGCMHLIDALHDRQDIQFVQFLHEQAASFAAESYAMFTGLGVCLVTSGPGATNAITGCAAAWCNSMPVLFISGQVQCCDLMKPDQRFNGAQEINIIDVIVPITKAVYQVHNPDRVEDCIDGLITMAQEGRRGPVWLDVPLDVQGAQV